MESSNSQSGKNEDIFLAVKEKTPHSLNESVCFSLQNYVDDVNWALVFNLLISDLMEACVVARLYLAMIKCITIAHHHGVRA